MSFKHVKHLKSTNKRVKPRTLKRTASRKASKAIGAEAPALALASTANWPAPRPLKIAIALPPVQPFNPTTMLPACLRDFVIDTADRMQASIDFCAAATLLMLAGATGRRARIQPKALDTGWAVVPNLYGAIVAPPGFMKSPVIAAVNCPAAAIEKRWADEFQCEMAEHLDANDSEQESEKPTPKRLLINDATFEKLHAILSENPAGVYVVRDEITGWLAELERKSREGERAFFLTAWNGDTPYAMDRIGRGHTYASALCLSMFGGLQPDRLRSYLSGAGGGIGLSDDGLMQRFQILVWPDTDSKFIYTDRPPNAAAQRVVDNIVAGLVGLDADAPLQFKFSPDAQKLFVSWIVNLEEAVRGNSLPPIMRGHMSKYKSLLPSIALLFELAEMMATKRHGGKKASFASRPNPANIVGSVGLVGYENQISVINTTRAILWVGYLQSHAERVYSLVSSAKESAARHLVGKVLESGSDTFTERDIQRRALKGLTSLAQIKDACRELVTAGWIRKGFKKQGKQVGRPSTTFEINPALTRGGVLGADFEGDE